MGHGGQDGSTTSHSARDCTDWINSKRNQPSRRGTCTAHTQADKHTSMSCHGHHHVACNRYLVLCGCIGQYSDVQSLCCLGLGLGLAHPHLSTASPPSCRWSYLDSISSISSAHPQPQPSATQNRLALQGPPVLFLDLHLTPVLHHHQICLAKTVITPTPLSQHLTKSCPPHDGISHPAIYLRCPN